MQRLQSVYRHQPGWREGEGRNPWSCRPKWSRYRPIPWNHIRSRPIRDWRCALQTDPEWTLISRWHRQIWTERGSFWNRTGCTVPPPSFVGADGPDTASFAIWSLSTHRVLSKVFAFQTLSEWQWNAIAEPSEWRYRSVSVLRHDGTAWIGATRWRHCISAGVQWHIFGKYKVWWWRGLNRWDAVDLDDGGTISIVSARSVFGVGNAEREQRHDWNCSKCRGFLG